MFFILFKGKAETVYAMARVFEQLFRQLYNVYGARVVTAYRGNDAEQVMVLDFNAAWNPDWCKYTDFIENGLTCTRRLREADETAYIEWYE